MFLKQERNTIKVLYRADVSKQSSLSISSCPILSARLTEKLLVGCRGVRGLVTSSEVRWLILRSKLTIYHWQWAPTQPVTSLHHSTCTGRPEHAAWN